VVVAQSVNLSVPQNNKTRKREASFRRLFVSTLQADSNTPLISDSAKTEDGILLDGSGQESSPKTKKEKERGGRTGKG